MSCNIRIDAIRKRSGVKKIIALSRESSFHVVRRECRGAGHAHTARYIREGKHLNSRLL